MSSKPGSGNIWQNKSTQPKSPRFNSKPKKKTNFLHVVTSSKVVKKNAKIVKNTNSLIETS